MFLSRIVSWRDGGDHFKIKGPTPESVDQE